MTSAPPRSRRLFVLGATGGTGRAVVDQALERGERVTVLARSPEKLGGARAGLTVVAGDPCDVDALRAVVSGHDAVLSMLGPPGAGRSTVIAGSARSTVAAMREAGVRRLVIVSAGVLFELGFVTALLRRTFLRNVAKDAGDMELLVRSSGLDWTIVRPPRLTNRPLTRRYRAEPDGMPRSDHSPATASLGRADLAHFLLDELDQPAHVHRIVGIASVKNHLGYPHGS